MPRPILTNPSRSPRHTIAVMGDSLSLAKDYGVPPELHWPEQLARALRGMGCLVKARNFARSGNRTGSGLVSSLVSVTDSQHTVMAGGGFFVGQTLTIWNTGGPTQVAVSSTSPNGANSNVNLAAPVAGMATGQTVWGATGSAVDMISRFGWMTKWDVPDIACIFGGVNDPGALWDSSTAPTRGAYVTDTLLAGSAQTALNVTNAAFQNGQWLVVGTGPGALLTQVASGGGTGTLTVSPALPINPALLPGMKICQGTRANLQWMIQSLVNAGVGRVVVVNTQFLNFAGGGGDMLTGGFPGTLSPYAPYAALRPHQAAAVATGWTDLGGPSWAAQGASLVPCDLFTFMERIVGNDTSLKLHSGQPAAGAAWEVWGNQVLYGGVVYTVNPAADCAPQVAQGTQSWHVANNNQHPNALGHFVIAQAVLASILAQPGWAAALQV